MCCFLVGIISVCKATAGGTCTTAPDPSRIMKGEETHGMFCYPDDTMESRQGDGMLTKCAGAIKGPAVINSFGLHPVFEPFLYIWCAAFIDWMSVQFRYTISRTLPQPHECILTIFSHPQVMRKQISVSLSFSSSFFMP